jgi:hypothetical protein
MASLNQKLRKASWLGTKIDLLRWLANLTGNLCEKAANRMEELTDQRDEVLDEIEKDRSEETNKED